MPTTTRSWTRVLALLLALVLIAAACGDDSSEDTSGGESEEAATGEEDEAAAGEEEVVAGEDEGDDAAADDDAADDDAADDDAADDGAAAMAPVMGGEISYLLEAESDTWDIPGANCAASCITVMRAVMDPLTIVNDQGEVEPFLLESFSSNEDFTEWTLVMQDGITFHDGTPADGAAVQRTLQEMAGGLLQGQVLVDLVNGPDSIELVDPMTVTLTFSRPFATFPYNIAERTGWLIAPSYWDNPERAAALAVGTGPFAMTEWTTGEQTVVERNDDYWRTDANGAELPYLDKIVFRPVPDVATRRATMESGDADVNMDSFAENGEFWENDWLEDGNNLLVPSEDRETTYLLINNASETMASQEFRTALADCTDREEYIAFRAPGNVIVDGPFSEGALGYLADPGFPQFDADAGNAILDEIGRPDTIVYGTTNVPSNLLTAELFVDMWGTNCGLNVEIDQFDQSELITKAITGDFEVFLWRNHGQGNPGLEFVWWHSRHAEGLALNFGRIIDPEMDRLLEATWATTDEAELDSLAADMNRVFASNVYNLWLNTTVWANPYAGDVHGVGVMTLPSGNAGQTGLAGRTWLQEAWVEAG